MKPEAFIERFKSAQPDLPSDIDIELAVFHPFHVDEVKVLPISEVDKEFLLVGLPEDATPYLSFFPSLRRFVDIDPYLGDDFSAFIALGHNGSGDYICLDTRDGKIIYHNHDNGMQEVFINSSIEKFAETLCLFAESALVNYASPFLKDLGSIDPPAVEPSAMWFSEYHMMREEFA
ncbi:hypothetical protein NT6N_23790 [Oceaniferula spumae]|uniref:Knr4/Smi1-like domain-containing protein n=1 Tax=Oceaniferula spumae TaxID=2979115 RepID=A0AAT9FN56_9BACT